MQYSNIYVRELGATPLQLGSVNSIAGFVQILISLPVGWFHDQSSLRKIFLTGITLSTLVSVLYGVAENWTFIIPAMILNAVALKLGSCVLICDLSLQSSDRATGKALCEGVGALPSFFAPTLAAVVIASLGGISVANIKPLFWIQAVARLLLLLYILFALKEIVRTSKSGTHVGILNDLKHMFQQGQPLKRYIAFYSLGMFTGSMVATFRYPYAYEIKGAGPYIVGWMATVSIIVEVLFATPIGRLSDRIGRKKVFYLLTPLYCLANLLLILSPTPEYLVVTALLNGFRMITGVATQGAMTPELVPTEYIGRWRGMLGVFGGGVSMLAPVVGGLIWESMSPHVVFIIPILIDLIMRTAILGTIPETITLKTD